MSFVEEFISQMPVPATTEQEAGQAEVAAAEQPVTTEQTQQDGAEVAADVQAGNENNNAEEPVASTEEHKEPEQPQAFDWGVFSERTGGAVKDEESFNSILDRANRYDELAKAKEELEANQFKPANPYIETLNKLVNEGAKPEQVRAFIKLNDYGSLDDLSPKDLLVAHKVLLGGYSEEVAKYKVDNDYDLSSFGEGDIEHKALQDDMRVAAASARKDLESYRAELTTVDNPGARAAEQEKLNQIAAEKQYTDLVALESPRIAAAADTTIRFSGKEGEGSVDVPFTKEFKDQIPGMARQFFATTRLDPRDPESQKQFNGYLEMSFMANNRDQVYSKLRATLESEIAEKYANKYESKEGLKPEAQNPNAKVQADDQLEFFNRMASGKS